MNATCFDALVAAAGFAAATASTKSCAKRGARVAPKAAVSSLAGGWIPPRAIASPESTTVRRRAVRVASSASASASSSTPLPNLTLNEVLAQLAAKSSARGVSAPTPRGTATSSSSSSAGDRALPPFQSDVEEELARTRERAAEDAVTSANAPSTTSVIDVKGIPPLPRPPPRPNTIAVVAASPSASAQMQMPRGAHAAAAATALDGGVFVAPAALTFAAGVVACVLGSALSAFLLAFIPTLRALKGAANEIADLAATIREEVPDTLAAVRLSGLELTDCLEEVGELTSEVNSGVKGTGRVLTMGVDTAGTLGKYAAETVRVVVPEVRKRATPLVQKARRAAEVNVERSLEENAQTEEYSGPVVVAAARATKSGVQYARGALRAAGVARQVGRLYKTARDWNQAGVVETQNDGK